MMKKHFRSMVWALLSMGLLVTACTDNKDYYDPEKEPGYVGKEASTLDFSTSQTVELQLNYDVANGFVSTFDLYTEYPLTSGGSLRTDLTPIAGGIDVKGTSKHSRVIPAHITKLYLYSGTMFVPLLSYAEINNGVANFQMMDVEIAETPDSRAGNAGSFWEKPISEYLTYADDLQSTTDAANKIYKFDLKNPAIHNTIPPEILTAISSTFKEANIVDEKYYKDATIKLEKGKEGQGGVEVFVSMLHSGAGFYNSLSYFVYTGDKELTELSQAEVEALEIINLFRFADVYTNTISAAKKNTLGLTPGKYIQLKYKNENGELVNEFPVGAQIGWILHPNSFHTYDLSIGNNMGRLFSVSYWNEAFNKTKNPEVFTNNYNIFFSATADNGDVYNCFGFEDQPKHASDGDCNDVVFHVLTNPTDAINPPPSITEEEKDIENTENKKGILAFEDNWPEKGDYDLNDVVVKYSSAITYTQTGTADAFVKKVEDKFSLVHSGATFNNAFSYKIDIAPSAIKKITISTSGGKSGATETIDYTNKIVADGNGFIIDLCTGVLDVIDPMTTVANPQNYTVVMEFVDGAVSQNAFSGKAAPYNPFIAAGGNYANAEVHLPMYTPTSRADMGLFGTEDDRSNKSTLWYVSGTNNKFPFAIHLDGVDSFDYKIERQSIDITYPNYSKWVDSDMTEYKDWYLK